MAAFKYGKFFSQSDHVEFDKEYLPGAQTGYAGIYRCISCRDEVAVRKGETLPTDDHEHSLNNGPIRWQMIAYAVTKIK